MKSALKYIAYASFLSIVILLSSLPGESYASGRFGALLSPGQLSNSHKKYEGLKSCTYCHKFGGGVLDSKCLECHKKLATRIKKKDGLHAKYTDICITCHIEHMGRDHTLISLDQDKFKHKLTGFILRGKHSKLICSKCHKRQGLYSGLVRQCISCHKDKHDKQLGRKCDKCHTPTNWKRPSRFKHNRDSAFKLKGAHLKLSCKKCHVKGHFKPINSSSCGTARCHGDQHKGQFKGKTCQTCHDRNYKDWKVAGRFDHDTASFKLQGKHRELECKKCHTRGRFKRLKSSSCGTMDCHGDQHKGQFKGKKCQTCHKSDFSTWRIPEFKHDNARFKLRGKHLEVECKKCHTRGRFKKLKYKSCGTLDCHGDRHKGQFKGKRCEKCHLSDFSTWRITGLSAKFKHNKNARFKLKGAHTKAKCAKCHVKGRFKPLPFKLGCGAVPCHGDNHKGQFKSGGKKRAKTCTACHDPQSRDYKVQPRFEHNRDSAFALTGKHSASTVECKDCHSAKKYRGLTSACYNCHKKDEPHKGKLGKVCKKCHAPKGWKELVFNHNKDTSFRLTREHQGVACKKCHVKKIYSDVSRNCFECHKK